MVVSITDMGAQSAVLKARSALETEVSKNIVLVIAFAAALIDAACQLWEGGCLVFLHLKPRA